MRLIDQNPADYITREVARLTEHDPSTDEQLALHLTMHSLAAVIADDVACGADPWPPTVARYIEARQRYQAAVLERNRREIESVAEFDRVYDLAGDPPEYQPDEDSGDA